MFRNIFFGRTKKTRYVRPTDYPFSTRPVLYEGFDQESSQQAIDDLQNRLVKKGLLPKASGKFDAETKAAVEDFQQKNGLQVDGIVGSFTWAALLHPRLCYSKELIPAQQEPAQQESVKTLQELLRQEGFDLKIDGHFGKKTRRSLKTFQRLYHLNPDGECGPMTWAVLLSQREKPTLKPAWMLFLLSWYQSLSLEPLLKIFSIGLGVYLSPIAHEPPFLETLATAYGLTCVVPLLIERLGLKLLITPNFPMTQFAPYVLTGIFWQATLDGIKMILRISGASEP